MLLLQKEYKLLNETTPPIEAPEFELAIYEAILASLKSRKLLTPDQVEACIFKLKTNFK